MYELIQVTIIKGLPHVEKYPVELRGTEFFIKDRKNLPLYERPLISKGLESTPIYEKGKFGAYIVSSVDKTQNSSATMLQATQILLKSCLENIPVEEEPSDVRDKAVSIYTKMLKTVEKIL